LFSPKPVGKVAINNTQQLCTTYSSKLLQVQVLLPMDFQIFWYKRKTITTATFS